jgi:hypothetical protein
MTPGRMARPCCVARRVLSSPGPATSLAWQVHPYRDPPPPRRRQSRRRSSFIRAQQPRRLHEEDGTATAPMRGTTPSFDFRPLSPSAPKVGEQTGQSICHHTRPPAESMTVDTESRGGSCRATRSPGMNARLVVHPRKIPPGSGTRFPLCSGHGP